MAFLVVIPALLTALGALFGHAIRPYWVSANSDPEYPYLLNSLALAEGYPPAHTDHPGTTLQTLGTLTLRARHAFSADTRSLRASVLRDPESALVAINRVLLAIHAAACWLVGWSVFRLTDRLWIAMAAQLAPGLEMTALNSLGRVVPESLLLSAALVFGAVALLACRAPPRRALGYAASLGAIAGLGLATKLTFAPVAACGLVIVVGRRARVMYAGAAAAAFALAVSPIWVRAPALCHWVWGLAVNTGPHGTPEQGAAILPREYLANFRALTLSVPFSAAVFALSAGVALILRLPAVWRGLDGPARAYWRVLLAGASAGILQAAMAAKFPLARHLTAAIGLLGVNVAMIVSLSIARGRWTAWVGPMLVTGMLAWAGRCTAAAFRWTTERAPQGVAAAIAVEKEGRQQLAQGRALVHGFCSSSPVAALGFGNEWAGRYFGDDLRAAHPHEFMWLWIEAPLIRQPDAHYSWFGRRISEEEISALAGASGVVFQGPKQFLPSGFTLEPLIESSIGLSYGPEGLFLARPPAKP